MTSVLDFGGVRFLLAGMLAAGLAACFVGRAEAASVLSSPVASQSVFANSVASGAQVVAGDRALTLKWSAVKGAAGYRVSWRGRALKGGEQTGVWSKKWLGLKVLKASARSYKAAGLANDADYQLRLESRTKAKRLRWVVRSTSLSSPKANSRTYAVGDTGPGGGKVFYAPGRKGETFVVKGAACGSGCGYLEAAPVGWNSGGSPDPFLAWGGGNSAAGQCSNKDIPGAAGHGIGAGKRNTDAIMAACPNSSGNQSAPAAFAASTYAPTVGGAVVTGWFLPSLGELNALDVSSVGGLTPNVYYWSSSQVSAYNAWFQDVGIGGGHDWQYGVGKYLASRVRAVRAF